MTSTFSHDGSQTGQRHDRSNFPSASLLLKKGWNQVVEMEGSLWGVMVGLSRRGGVVTIERTDSNVRLGCSSSGYFGVRCIGCVSNFLG